MILYGRNVLKEAIYCGVEIDRIYFGQEGDRRFIEELQPQARVHKGLPRQVMKEPHQGVAFETSHDFYLEDLPAEYAEQYPLMLLCNHLEDVQNLGSIARLAAAFGVGLIVHESKRSARLTPAAIKVSMGFAFHLKFLEVANLVPLTKSLQKNDYDVIALDQNEKSSSLYDWEPHFPMAFIVGSEAEGISRPLKKQSSFSLHISMAEGVESLNASQAAGVAMSYAYSFAERAGVKSSSQA